MERSGRISLNVASITLPPTSLWQVENRMDESQDGKGQISLTPGTKISLVKFYPQMPETDHK